MKAYFSTKGQTLKNLKIQTAVIPKIFLFKVSEYKKNKDKIINKIQKKFKKKIIVRSSNFLEDSLKQSFAGKFETILNIQSKDKIKILHSIEKVIDSYKKKKSSKNEILIQPMIDNVSFSGVVTTLDLKNLSPYYIINIKKGSDTTSITSGKHSGKQIIVSPYKKIKLDIYTKKIILLAQELENVFNNNFLDIEFAISKKKIYLLQVRRISQNIINQKKILSKNDLHLSLTKLEKKIFKLQKPHPSLYGNTTFFGVMPDWNPAEIIGIKPKPLALSMYQELITDHIWAKSREKFGFKDVSGNHLMTNFFGTPYIDVRVDFNSWIPETLSKEVAKKLIKYYLTKFKRNRKYHDKIEFEIIFTCFSPLTEKRLKELRKNNFSKKEINEIAKSLKRINNLSFIEINNLIRKLKVLEIKQKEIQKSKMYTIDKIYWLIEDCKKYGTYSFAGLARCGFIAIEILNALQKNQIFSNLDKQNFLESINTITTEMIRDNYDLSKKNFIQKYGHLRPNTYEITSKNYKQAYNIYYGKILKKQINKKTFQYTSFQKSKINTFLKKNFNNIDFFQFNKFLKKSIYFREYGKFIFSKSIDLIFTELKKLGRRYQIPEGDLSFIEINEIKKLYYNLNNDNISELLKNNISLNKKNYNFNLNIRLCDTITSKKDIYYFTEKDQKINFVTQKITTGKIKLIKDKINVNINNHIIAIKNADPGYDFIFSQNIKGLITCYGGANSHMAIRCAELNIPAAIGIGNKRFEQLKNNQLIEINPQLEKLNYI